MSTQNIHIHAGRLFCLSRGEYSDYGYSGHFLALVEITPEMFAQAVDDAKAAAREENSADTTGWYEDSEGAERKFIPALIKRGWIMDIDCIEIHTGSYGELSLS